MTAGVVTPQTPIESDKEAAHRFHLWDEQKIRVGESCKKRMMMEGTAGAKTKSFWQRLHKIQGQALSRDQRIEELGGACDRAGRVVAAQVKTKVKSEGHLAFYPDRNK